MVTGDLIDQAFATLLLGTFTPLALEVALTVQAELEARADQADRLRRAAIQRARHAAELARRRYLAVDPDNRLVAATLEADWNDALRQHTAVAEHHERDVATSAALDDEQHDRIAAPTTVVCRVAVRSAHLQRKRSRMICLLSDDVTLAEADDACRCGSRMVRPPR